MWGRLRHGSGNRLPVSCASNLVRSQASPWSICAGRSDGGIRFSASTSGSPCQCHSTNTPYTLQVPPVSVIPPTLHIHCRLPLSVSFHQHSIYTAGSPCQWHSTNTPYTLQAPPVSVIPPTLHIYCRLPLSVSFHQHSIYTAGSPCQCHSTNTPYTLQAPPVSVIPPTLHIHSLTPTRITRSLQWTTPLNNTLTQTNFLPTGIWCVREIMDTIWYPVN